MNIKSIVLFVLCCLAPASYAVAREIVLKENIIRKMKPIAFLNYTKGLRRQKIQIKYDTPQAATMAKGLLKKAKIQKKKEAISEDLGEEIEELKTELAQAKKKLKLGHELREKFKALEDKVAALEKEKEAWKMVETKSPADLKKQEKKLKAKLAALDEEKETVEEEIPEAPSMGTEVIEGEGAPLPPPSGDMPGMPPAMKPTKKPTEKKEPTKPKLPAVLTKEKIERLTEKEKKASDQLFFKVLRDISQQSYTGDFKKYLKFLLETLREKVREVDVFKKRAEFDEVFGKGVEKTVQDILGGITKELVYEEGEFQKLVQEKMETPAENNLNTFLDNMYKDFTGLGRLVRKVEGLLSLCVFDAKKMASERDYIVTMLINFIVGLRTTKGNNRPDSDEEVAQVLENLKDKKGRFKDKKHPIEQLGHEFDFLRINKKFLRFNYLIGEGALKLQSAGKGTAATKAALEPLLLVIRYSELNSLDFKLTTFKARIKKQLFFDPDTYFDDVLGKSKLVTEEKIVLREKTKVTRLVESEGLKGLKRDLKKYFEYRQVATTAAFNILAFLEKRIAEKKVKDLKSLRVVFKALKKRLKDKKPLEKIEKMIDAMKKVDDIVKQFETLVGEQKEATTFDDKLRVILTRDQTKRKISGPIKKILLEAKELYEKRVKKEPFFKVGKILYEKLKQLPEVKKNEEISTFLDATFIYFFRTPVSVSRFFKKNLFSEDYKKLYNKYFFIKTIEPYGLLLRALEGIGKPSESVKKIKLEDGRYGLLIDVLRSLDEAQLFGDAKKYRLIADQTRIVGLDFTYKGRVGEILKSVKSFDLRKLKEEIKNFVALSGVETVEKNVRKKIEETEQYKTIISGVVKLVIERSLSGITKHLKELNKGSGIFEGEVIMKGLPLEGIGRHQKNLRNAVFLSLKGLFKDLISKIDEGKKDWNKFNLDEKSEFTQEINRVKGEIEKKVTALDAKGLANPDKEKKTIISLIQKFIDEKLKQLQNIKESVTGAQ